MEHNKVLSRSLIFLFLASMIIPAAVPEASAVPSHLNNFTIKYPAAAGSRIAVCDLCHIPPFPSIANRNQYGFDFGNQTLHFINPNQSFASIESNDSDGDGFTNIAEINALTFPGNASDFPAVPGFIAGTVTNASNTSQLIAGATVSAGGLTATTNATGFYNLSIAAGTYTVNASAAGFATNTTAGVAVTAAATTTVNFALAPAAGVLGDASGDGQVTIVDALFIAQLTVGLRTLTPAQLAQADVNHDTRVDITDALFIAQATVGLRVLV